jgi:hypothetical protein
MLKDFHHDSMITSWLDKYKYKMPIFRMFNVLQKLRLAIELPVILYLRFQ